MSTSRLLYALRKKTKEYDTSADALKSLQADMYNRAEAAVSRTVKKADDVVGALARAKFKLHDAKRRGDVRSIKFVDDASEEFIGNKKQLMAIARALGSGHAPSSNLATLEFAYKGTPKLPFYAAYAPRAYASIDHKMEAAFEGMASLPDSDTTEVSEWLGLGSSLGSGSFYLKTWDEVVLDVKDSTDLPCLYITPDDVSLRCMSNKTLVSNDHFKVKQEVYLSTVVLKIAYKAFVQPLPLTVLRNMTFDVSVLNVPLARLPFVCDIDATTFKMEFDDAKPAYSKDLLFDYCRGNRLSAIAAHSFNGKEITFIEDGQKYGITFEHCLLHVQIITDGLWVQAFSDLLDVPVEHRNTWCLIIIRIDTTGEWIARMHNMGTEQRVMVCSGVDETRQYVLAFKTEGNAIVVAQQIPDDYNRVRIVRHEITVLNAAPVVQVFDVPHRMGENEHDRIFNLYWNKGALTIKFKNALWLYEGGEPTQLSFTHENDFTSDVSERWELTRAFRVPAAHKRTGTDLMAVHAESRDGKSEIRLYDRGNCVGITRSKRFNFVLMPVSDTCAFACVSYNPGDKTVRFLPLDVPAARL